MPGALSLIKKMNQSGSNSQLFWHDITNAMKFVFPQVLVIFCLTVILVLLASFLNHIFFLSGKIPLASMRATLHLRFLGFIGLSMVLMFLIRSSILSLLELIWRYISPTLKNRKDLHPYMVLLKSYYLTLSRLTSTCESSLTACIFNLGCFFMQGRMLINFIIQLHFAWFRETIWIWMESVVGLNVN